MAFPQVGLDMILDCGCGTKPVGDVNVDIIIYPECRNMDNFLRCDVHFLPFKNLVFSKAVCYCVLEHLNRPHDGLKEIFRVTNGEVIIRYDRLLSIYNFIGVGHKNMMVKERFVRLPSVFFKFLYKVFMFRPLKTICRRAKLFEPQTYERAYHV